MPVIKDVYIDIMDFWSLLSVLKLRRKLKNIFYLSRSNEFFTNLFEWFLTLLGINFHQVESCFENKSHVDIHKSILDFLLSQVRETAQIQIASINTLSQKQLERLTHSLVLEARNEVRFGVELIEAVGEMIDLKKESAVLIKKCQYSDSLRKYGSDKNIKIIFYSAPLRLKNPGRPGFTGDSIQNTASAAFHILKFMKIIAIYVCETFLAALLIGKKLFESQKTSKYKKNYQIIALTVLPNPRAGFNELYWVKYCQILHNMSVLSLSIDRLTTQGNIFYNTVSDHLIPFHGKFKLSGMYGLLDTKHIIRYLVKSAMWFFRITEALLKTKISFGAYIHLLEITDKMSFFEALMRSVGAQLAWTMIEGHDVNSQALVLAATQIDGICLGGTWSMAYHPAMMFSYNRNDIIFLWGCRQKGIIQESKPILKRYVYTGYPTIKYFAEQPLKHWKSHKRIITFYDNICNKNVIITCDELRALYNTLIKWSDRNPENLLIFKTKRNDCLKLGENIADSINDRIKKGNVVVMDEHGDLTPGLISDVVIGVSSSSLATISAALGRPCILYDSQEVMDKERWPLNIEHVIRIKEISDLIPSIESALLIKPNSTKNGGGDVDAFVDMEGDKRAAYYIGKLYKSLKDNKAAKLAIDDADFAYKKKWGADKIFSHVV